MKHITALIIATAITACGTDHTIDGGTTNKLEVSVVVEHRMPICEQPMFDTTESILACIEAVTSQTLDAEILAENLTSEQIDAILGSTTND